MHRRAEYHKVLYSEVQFSTGHYCTMMHYLPTDFTTK